ncbi:hypothetical protein ACFLU6_01385 [Acidobacteriota bacterium]
MDSGKRRRRLWGEALIFLFLTAVVTLASLWMKVYLDSQSYFVKAEGIFQKAQQTGRPGELMRTAELYLSSIRSYAPLNRSNRIALAKILAIGQKLEGTAHQEGASGLYRRTRAALSSASSVYVPHSDLDRELKARMARLVPAEP